MTKRGMNVGRLAPAFFAYFLQPPCVTGVFPFLQPAPFETTYMGQTIKEVTFGGILACLPMLWVLAFTRRILRMRDAPARPRAPSAGVIVVLLASGVHRGAARCGDGGHPAALLRRFQLHVPGRRGASVLRGERAT